MINLLNQVPIRIPNIHTSYWTLGARAINHFASLKDMNSPFLKSFEYFINIIFYQKAEIAATRLYRLCFGFKLFTTYMKVDLLNAKD